MANVSNTDASAKAGTTAAKASTDASGVDNSGSGATAETVKAQKATGKKAAPKKAQAGSLPSGSDVVADADGGDLVEVELTQHWTDDDGVNHEPESKVWVTPQVAESLRSTKWAVAEVPDADGAEPAGGRYVRNGAPPVEGSDVPDNHYAWSEGGVEKRAAKEADGE